MSRTIAGTARHLWATRRITLIAFVIALAGTVFFGARAVVHYGYWATHREIPVEAWMTIGYVARSWQVDRSVLIEAAMVKEQAGDRRTLARIASDNGEDVDALIGRIQSAIEQARAGAPSETR